MIFRFKTHKRVDKFLAKHPIIAKKLMLLLKKIVINPFENNCDIKNLKGQKNHYRLRIGKYRFLYEIKNDIILIYIYGADSRGEIYKQ